MSLISLLENPELKRRYAKVKRYFHLRESAYDVTSACQLRCQGCYYFSGAKYTVRDDRDVSHWKRHLEGEKSRGINYVNLAGAEPSLVPDILRACYQTIPLGTIFTNGLIPIDREIGYRIHISVWGNAMGDSLLRPLASRRPTAPHLPTQLDNYRNDQRVIFVYTFNETNVGQVEEVVRAVKAEGHRLTFNVFSPPEGFHSGSGGNAWLDEVRSAMLVMLDKYSDTVLYSQYSARVHSDSRGLRERFGCPYPRASLADLNAIGIGTSFRSYRADFTHESTTDCCVPDTDCSTCRHYAAGSAIVTHRLDLHTASEALFRGWLDYVDTYLAVWLVGYQRDPDLYTMTSQF